MLTKAEKQASVAKGEDIIAKSNHILFADFTGIPTAGINKLRALMRELGGSFNVIKKRLLRIALKNKGIDFDPVQFEAQAGMIAAPQEIYDTAGKLNGLIKELAKAKKDLKVLGGVNLKSKAVITAEEFVKIAKLPSREALLTQIAFMLTMPVKKLMVALHSQQEKIQTKG